MTRENLIKTYNVNGEFAEPMTREEAERKGLILATVVVALFNTDGYVWLSLRSHKKSTHRGMWDITVAGCVDKDDESNLAAATRETREEAGLDIKLMSVGKLRLTFIEEGREVVRMPEVFYAVTDEIPQPADGESDGFAKYPMEIFLENYEKYPDLITRGIQEEIGKAYEHLIGEQS